MCIVGLGTFPEFTISLFFRAEDVDSEVVDELKKNEGFVFNKRRGTAHLFRY